MGVRSIVVAVVMLGGLIGAPSVARASTPPPIRPEEAQIQRLYVAVFDRAPDDAGYAYWYERLATGLPLRDVAALFVTSPEFQIVAGAPTNAGFVDLLYRNVLGRSPEPAGLDYWLDRMGDGLDRVTLVVLFSESPEFIATTGTALPHLPAFDSRIEPVTAADLGSSWQPGCPVDPVDLRRIIVSHVGFDGLAASGQIVVHRTAAEATVEIFRKLYNARYPIERLILVDHYGGDDLASMEANNSSGFNCRRVTGGTAWSEHAYGRAIDLNPIQNPYVTPSVTLPAAGAAWTDRSAQHPALIHRGDVVVTAFAAAGWEWGGDFSSIADWQHFSVGR